MQRFLPFLPDGEAAGEGGEALAIIAEDLEWLLAADAAELWGVARADPSLALLIASFLQYAKRPHDEGFSQQPATSLAVWQRMLPLLHRLACGQEPGAPSQADRCAVLASLLDLPRLLDACALYGPAAAAEPGSPVGTQLGQLVAATLRLLPRLSAQAAQAGPLVAENLGQVAEACLGAAGKAARDAAMMQSLQDGIAYLRDTCLTLAALLQAHPPAAALLLQQGPALVEALGAVHDQLLPAVHKLARSSGAGGDEGGPRHALLMLMLRQACHVELASERLAQLLLLHAYIQPTDEAGGGSGTAGSSRAGAGGGSAVARGEALLQALMVLGHREEEAGAGGSCGGATGGLPLAEALAQRLGLGGSVQAALQTGALSLDDAQADYVAALLGVSSLDEAPGPPLVSGAKRVGSTAGVLGAGSSGSRASGLDLAQLKSKIQQVKDLLPDFGDGFVAACLQQLGGSPERVLNALLEDALPALLAGMDRQLSLEAWQAAADSTGTQDKGKRPVGGMAGAAGGSYDADFPATLPSVGGGAGAARAAGAAQPRAEDRTARYLDVREETYREALVSAANAAQWEYDDEYDDSFDDLIAFGADGVTEVEGEGPAVAAGPPPRGAALQAGVPAFQPASRPPAGGAAPAGRGPKSKGSRLWVLDGRIYNYAKPGAQEVGSQQEAAAVLTAAEQAAAQIMGLGPGGNKPWRSQEQQQAAEGASSSAGGEGEAAGGAGPGSSDAGRGGDGRGGRRGGGRGGGQGGARGDHRFKDQHKSAIANHHRRERAIAKQGRGMW